MKKLNVSIFVILTLLLNNDLIAKPNFLSWETTINSTLYNVQQLSFNKIILTNDNNIFGCLNNEKSNYSLVKVNQKGNLDWHYQRSNSFLDTNYVERLNFNNIILNEFENNYYTIITTKYLNNPTSYGDLIEYLTINSSGLNSTKLLIDKKDLIETSISLLADNENSILSASIVSYLTSNNKPLLNTVSKFGKILNRKESNELNDQFSIPISISKLNDDYVIANSPTNNLFLSNNEIFVRLYNKELNLILDKKINANELDPKNKFLLVSCIKTIDNNIFIVGNSIDENKISKGFLIILDKNFKIVSKNIFSNNTYINSITVKNNVAHLSGYFSVNKELNNFLYIQSDIKNQTYKEFIWNKDSINCIINDIVSDEFNNLYLAGKCGNNAYISKINLNSTFVDEELVNCIEIYPNPSKETLNLKLSSEPEISEELTITDILGNSVLKIPIKDMQSQVDISHLVSGLYLCKLRQSGTMFKIEVVK